MAQTRGLRNDRVLRDIDDKSAIAALSPREREVLYRFYAIEQDSADISRDLGLDPKEFRKLNERAKEAFLNIPST
jgi:DNA-directed RNA polymerase specialized sigma24 family protein